MWLAKAHVWSHHLSLLQACHVCPCGMCVSAAADSSMCMSTGPFACVFFHMTVPGALLWWCCSCDWWPCAVSGMHDTARRSSLLLS